MHNTILSLSYPAIPIVRTRLQIALQLSRQGPVRHTAGTVRCMYGMVQLHTSGRYNIRRNVTKSERYKNGMVHDFSL